MALPLVVTAVLTSVASGFVVSTSSLSTSRHVSTAAVAVTPPLRQQRPGARATTARPATKMAADSVADIKCKVLQLAAIMDRGGMANPGDLRDSQLKIEDLRLKISHDFELKTSDSTYTVGARS